ncbi:hypothetical protein [Niveispirillum sp. KHB5.9]|uniref:hypothetical protein n=1 Tax=Niveispirillum sp. KHB5.9 TaxID=3400269 RepID=UPI003A8C49D8
MSPPQVSVAIPITCHDGTKEIQALFRIDGLVAQGTKGWSCMVHFEPLMRPVTVWGTTPLDALRNAVIAGEGQYSYLSRRVTFQTSFQGSDLFFA